VAPISSVHLEEAGEYAILSKSGISTVPSSMITGNIAVSPIAATAMTGFSLILDSGGQFSLSTQLEGQAYSASYGAPISAALTTAVGAMEAAYTDAASRLNDDAARINLLGGILSGATLTPGVYTFGTNVLLAGDVTFSGSATDVFIIQMTGNLVQATNKSIILSNGALAENIFWQVAGFVQVGAGAHMEGIILAKTKVDFLTGASLNGRVLTQTACNLQSTTITESPAVASSERRGLRSN
jgi:hypothetical protein